MTTMTSRHFRLTGLATSWKARIRTRSDSRWNSQVANSGFMSLLNFSKIIARFITSLSIWLPVAIHLSKRLTIVINYSRRISSQYYSRVRNYDRYGFYEANQRIEIFICVCKTSFAIGKRECWYKKQFYDIFNNFYISGRDHFFVVGPRANPLHLRNVFLHRLMGRCDCCCREHLTEAGESLYVWPSVYFVWN